MVCERDTRHRQAAPASIIGYYANMSINQHVQQPSLVFCFTSPALRAPSKSTCYTWYFALMILSSSGHLSHHLTHLWFEASPPKMWHHPPRKVCRRDWWTSEAAQKINQKDGTWECVHSEQSNKVGNITDLFEKVPDRRTLLLSGRERGTGIGRPWWNQTSCTWRQDPYLTKNVRTILQHTYEV